MVWPPAAIRCTSADVAHPTRRSRPALFWQPKQSGFPPWLGLAAAAVVLLGAALVWLLSNGEGATEDAAIADTNAVTPPSSPPPPRPPAEAPRPKPSTADATPPDPSASAVVPQPSADVESCVAAMLPPDTFAREQPAMSFVCDQRDPRKGAIELEARVVLAQAKGEVTDGMKEWSLLSWYEMAAFAFARARCCEGVKPVRTPLRARCDFDAALVNLVATASTGTRDALGVAQQDYEKAIRCAIETQLHRFFEWHEPIVGPERTTFEKMVARARGR